MTPNPMDNVPDTPCGHSFRAEMVGRQYGYEETMDAWASHRDGWDAAFKDFAKHKEELMKTLHNSTVSEAKNNVKDLQVVGNGDMFQLLCKASSKDEKWMKSTKAMEIPGVGCVVQVTTQQDNHVAEAVTFVPGVKIIDDEDGGRRLVKFTLMDLRTGKDT